MNVFEKLRKEKELTQVNLAKILNIRQTTVSSWENNISVPDYPTLIRLANLYDVSTDYLLGRTDDFGSVIATNTPMLSNDEQTVIECMRSVTEDDRKLIIENAKFVRYNHSKNKKVKFN